MFLFGPGAGISVSGRVAFDVHCRSGSEGFNCRSVVNDLSVISRLFNSQVYERWVNCGGAIHIVALRQYFI